ncbi:MAG: phosphoribosylanthranilate isomerase [Rhizobiales bacterium]|nr:phosphoribosylanthranilate isomerase [Hyphomicrobiales bacterium]
MARAPDFITFTGIDDRTPIEALEDLSARYPIEWGVLLDPAQQGNVPRFPSQQTIARVAASGLRLAAHLCGAHTEALRDGEPAHMPLALARFARIQINSHTVGVTEASRFGATIGKRCILPCTGDRFPDAEAVDWLHDLSGGRGLATGAWPPYPGRLAGYAGGIGPDTAAAVVAAIGAEGPYWIDMESRIRTDDWLDLELCERVCRAVYGA